MPLSHKLADYDVPPHLSVPGFPKPHSSVVMSPLLGVILDRSSSKTSRPAPSMVPSIWTYRLAQSLEEGLLAPSAALYTPLSHRDISSYQIPPFNFSWGDSGCRPYEPQTPVDTCQVAPPPKDRKKHPPPAPRGEGCEGAMAQHINNSLQRGLFYKWA